MNIHIKPSTSPMRDGPLGRPDKCPACGAAIYHDPLDVLFIGGENYFQFECGLVMIWNDVPPIGAEVKRPCSRANPIDTCLRLRAELDAARAEVELQQKNITFKAKQLVELRAERDELREYSDKQHSAIVRDTLDIVELEAELDAEQAEMARIESDLTAHAIATLQQGDTTWRVHFALEHLTDQTNRAVNAEMERDSALARVAELQARLQTVEGQRDTQLEQRLRLVQDYDALDARLGAVMDAAQAVADDVCSLLCPSVKKTETEWTHHPKCIALRAALAAAPAGKETG